jgi:hypothetical protein
MSSPGNDLTKSRLNSCCDFGKDLGGEMKVVLSSRKVLMPQIGCQKRKFGFEILTVSVPTA